MIELGAIYLRDNDIQQAKHWFSKVKALPEFQQTATARLQLTEELFNRRNSQEPVVLDTTE